MEFGNRQSANAEQCGSYAGPEKVCVLRGFLFYPQNQQWRRVLLQLLTIASLL